MGWAGKGRVTYIDNRAPARRGGMSRVLEDIFLAETPVAPAEIPHLVDAVEVEYCNRHHQSFISIRGLAC